MSYLVLARKWRPKRFAELVGQEHVVRALCNALNSGRVHHAFLFTGTRGVGKTTIARIFAKSLNCEHGSGADPCGKCSVCLDIDAGRYADLLEIDAASNTGVDDVRELIENAQYLPSRGTYKVYLIDEVHMLSRAAFNALLKTLEEPPEHVKFLLATTDPQKLPVTVLSRCLQFNLKRLDEGQISAQMQKIMQAEGIAFDPPALAQLAHAADGSLRDGLSLLDQAIAYAGGELRQEPVQAMLGTVDRNHITALLYALAANDGARLLQAVTALADFSPDWNDVLDALSQALHRIQVQQLVPGTVINERERELSPLAQQLRPEVVQLWYQMTLHGRRDLPLAPSQRSGFEMTVLRMLAFHPAPVVAFSPAITTHAGMPTAPVALSPPAPQTVALTTPHPPIKTVEPSNTAPLHPTQATVATNTQPPVSIAPVNTVSHPAAFKTEAMADSSQSSHVITNAEQWLDWVKNSTLSGTARELAANVGFIRCDGQRLFLTAPDIHYLKSEAAHTELEQAIQQHFGSAMRVVFEMGAVSAETLHQRDQRQRDQRQQAAETAFMQDSQVQLLLAQGAKIIPGSIYPIDPSS